MTLAKTRDKLAEAWFFLEKLEEAKLGTAPFRFYFSALIGAARSVTWVLQAELRRQHGGAFDEWWARHRDALPPDDLPFATLRDLRNQIMKRGTSLPVRMRVEGVEKGVTDGIRCHFEPYAAGSHFELEISVDPQALPPPSDLFDGSEEEQQEKVGRYAANALMAAMAEIDTDQIELVPEGLTLGSAGPRPSDEIIQAIRTYLENLEHLLANAESDLRIEAGGPHEGRGMENG